VDLVIIFDSNGSVTMGRIIDIVNGSLVVKDISGFRHWINPEAIVRVPVIVSVPTPEISELTVILAPEFMVK